MSATTDTTYSVYEMDMGDLDPNLVNDLRDAGETTDGYALYGDDEHAGDAPNAEIQILWHEEAGRAGIVYTGSGSSGHTTWTDANSPEDALRRYVEDDIRE